MIAGSASPARSVPEPNGALRVLAETAYPDTTAASRVRITGFVPFLRPHGIELRPHATLRRSEYGLITSNVSIARKSVALASAAVRTVREERPAHDLLFIQRLRFLTPVPGVDPPRRIDVYDFDDALFLGSEGALNRYAEWIKQEARRCVAYLRRTKLAIAGNSFLADTAARYAPRVEVVPSCIDPTQQRTRTHGDAEELVIGWIGSRSTSQYLRVVLPAIERLVARGINAKLVLVGATCPAQVPWIEARPWSAATEASDLASFDVGIMPLPDNDWGRGKCGYKVLQYFSAGVPAVASPVGVARELVGPEAERGLLASSTEEWAAALAQLLGSLEERRQRGALARSFVESDYSYQRWAPELAGLLRSIA